MISLVPLSIASAGIIPSIAKCILMRISFPNSINHEIFSQVKVSWHFVVVLKDRIEMQIS